MGPTFVPSDYCAAHHIALFLRNLPGYSRWIDPIACTNLCATLVANPASASCRLPAPYRLPGVSRGCVLRWTYYARTSGRCQRHVA